MNETLTLGSFIRLKRKEKKMTLKQLAEITNLTHGYLSKVENDQYTPKISTLEVIADSLNVSYEKLMELSGYIEKTDLTKLEEAITKLESHLYNYLTQKKYWDSLSEEIKNDVTIYDETLYNDIETSINVFEMNLETLKKIHAQIDNPSENITGIDDLILVPYRNTIYKHDFPDSHNQSIILDRLLNLKESVQVERISLDRILKSNIPVEINGKILNVDEKNKLLIIAETMFSNNKD